jgi:hypothetical protein
MFAPWHVEQFCSYAARPAATCSGVKDQIDRTDHPTSTTTAHHNSLLGIPLFSSLRRMYRILVRFA